MYNLSTINEYKLHNKNTPIENLLYYTEESIYMRESVGIALLGICLGAIIAVVVAKIIKFFFDKATDKKSKKTIGIDLDYYSKPITLIQIPADKLNKQVDFYSYNANLYNREALKSYNLGTAYCTPMINVLKKCLVDKSLDLSALTNIENSIKSETDVIYSNLDKFINSLTNNNINANYKDDNYHDQLVNYFKDIADDILHNPKSQSQKQTLNDLNKSMVTLHNDYIMPFLTPVKKYIDDLKALQKEPQCAKGYYDSVANQDCKDKMEKIINFFNTVLEKALKYITVGLGKWLLPLLNMEQEAKSIINKEVGTTSQKTTNP